MIPGLARRFTVGVCLWLGLASGSVLRALDGHTVSGVVFVGDRPAGDVVVWLEGIAIPPPSRHRAVLDQRNLAFAPHVLAVPVGTSVEMPNSDRVFHNVFSFKDGKRFDLGLYPAGASKTVTFDRPGLSRVFCNIHPQMAGYVLAVESEYVAVSDRNGGFTLPVVPEGVHPYRAWRPGGQVVSGEVVVTGHAVVEIRLP